MPFIMGFVQRHIEREGSDRKVKQCVKLRVCISRGLGTEKRTSIRTSCWWKASDMWWKSSSQSVQTKRRSVHKHKNMLTVLNYLAVPAVTLEILKWKMEMENSKLSLWKKRLCSLKWKGKFCQFGFFLPDLVLVSNLERYLLTGIFFTAHQALF